MKKFLIVATALFAGTAVAQTAPVAQPAPTPAVPPTPPTPMAHPMHDRVTTRAEVVQKVREHFGQMDANKDGAITTAEIDQSRDKIREDFKARDGGHAMMMGDPNVAFDRLDANKDGSISRDEFTKARELRVERRIEKREARKNMPKESREVRRHVMRMGGRGGFGGRMIVMADTNKDGQITQAEAEALALQHFDQMDTNRDGQVTPEERRAGRPMMFKQKLEEKKSGS
jgi:Ca2+-binding EF-hand superfamily protein